MQIDLRSVISQKYLHPFNNTCYKYSQLSQLMKPVASMENETKYPDIYFALVWLGGADFQFHDCVCDFLLMLSCLCLSMLQCFMLSRPTQFLTDKTLAFSDFGVSFSHVASLQLNVFLLLFAEVVWRPPSKGQPGPSAGLGRRRHLGVHQAGLHPEVVSRPHNAAPPGRRYRALRQQDARSVCNAMLILILQLWMAQ